MKIIILVFVAELFLQIFLFKNNILKMKINSCSMIIKNLISFWKLFFNIFIVRIIFHWISEASNEIFVSSKRFYSFEIKNSSINWDSEYHNEYHKKSKISHIITSRNEWKS